MASTHQRHEAVQRGARMLRTALGPAIARFLEDPAIVEVLLNPDGRIWVDRLSEGLADTGEMMSPADGERIVRLVAHHVGAEVHTRSPRVSAELPESGERFEGLLPPIVVSPTFAIRKPAVAVFTLEDYVAAHIMSAGQADTLRAAVQSRANILVAGGTSTGKTTLTNALLAEVAKSADRVVLIEDTRELQCAAPNLVAMRTKDGVATLSDLVRSSLRLRPDRIPIGEVRGGEALDLLKAWATGHPGGIGTIHAGTGVGALRRMEQLIQEAIRWCSDHLELKCRNGDVVRILFVIDACDREIIAWSAVAHAGVSGEMVRDLMVEAVEQRFGDARTPYPVEWLSDNGSAYIARETATTAGALGLRLAFTPARSPQSNGISEAFVKTLKRDYARNVLLPDAETVLALLPKWFDDYNEIHPHSGLRFLSPREFRAKAAGA